MIAFRRGLKQFWGVIVAVLFLAATIGAVPGRSSGGVVSAATTSTAGSVTLGVNGIPKCIRLSADQGPTGENDTTMNDLTFTPAANSNYVVTLTGAFSASAGTVGLYYYVLHGDATDGAVWGQTRGASATGQAGLFGTQSTTFVQGTTSGSSWTPFMWTSVFESDADPTAVTVVYRAETSSGGTVTIQAGVTNLCYWRSVP